MSEIFGIKNLIGLPYLFAYILKTLVLYKPWTNWMQVVHISIVTFEKPMSFIEWETADMNDHEMTPQSTKSTSRTV